MPPQTPSTLCTPSAASRIDPRMTILRVGSTRYSLNIAMLSLHSTMLRDSIKEEESGILLCPDWWDIGAFDVFIDWIYTRRFPSTYRPWGIEPPQPLDGDACVRIYIFGWQIDASELRAAIECKAVSFFVQNDYYAPFDTVNLAFAALPHEHVMLELLVDAHCRSFRDDAQGKWEMQQESKLPGKFLVGVMRRYARVGARKELRASDYLGHRSVKKRKRWEEEEAVESVESGDGEQGICE
ncbi:hypothetical protein HBH50_134970 [Parastagonospora nodorum]|nr:hypothetical protein HBH50_134970 [Parastagonospora nodorum]KAH4085286.1 hypothetical protein HBH48_158990 [Parastagonospora nodorum]